MTSPFNRLIPCLWLSLSALLIVAIPVRAGSPYQGFEARQVHPIDLTPDGQHLLALHSEAAALVVFDVSDPLSPPLRIMEIPVGLEPVSVRARSNDEIWVVNEVSDHVSIISLNAGCVTHILEVGDEPADVLFVGNQAFITCARDNAIHVYDADNLALLQIVQVEGIYPQALALSPDQSKLYAAFLHSGNGTTILSKDKAPNPPAPSNPNLPSAPKTALIVPVDHPQIVSTILDHDVVEIDVATRSVTAYHSGLGTNLFGLATRPGTGDLWIANTEALNLIRFEPELNARFALNRLSVLPASPGNPVIHDLNPGIDYHLLPNPAAQQNALAQPSQLLFDNSGTHLWVAAFASDRIAKIDAASGQILERVDLRPAGQTSDQMRGPRGLAWHQSSERLFVLNKLSATLSVIDTQTAGLLQELPLSPHEPLDDSIKAGRGYLFDARLSGNGTVSCGICHMDADRDGLVWDLGDPGGSMLTVMGANHSAHDFTPRPRSLHPMKGPMTTQTLRGMQQGAPFHWRGDKPGIEDFNSTFPNLMGGEEIDADDMASLVAYLMSLRHHPNPNRNLDGSLPASFDGANPIQGRDLFLNEVKGHCHDCHFLPTGSDNNLDLMAETGLSQPVKTPPLRTVYQRLFFDPRPARTALSGFGILHDGAGFSLPIGHEYVLDQLETLQELRDVAAFLMCFDTGTAPVVGLSQLVNAATQQDAGALARIQLLESRASLSNPTCNLVVRGMWNGEARRWLFDRTQQLYRADRAADGYHSRQALLSGLQAGDALTFMGVLPGQGNRLGGDEDNDGVLDGDDPDPGAYNGPPSIQTQPRDRAIAPGGTLVLQVEALGSDLTYAWYHNDLLLPDQFGPTLSLIDTAGSAAGSYRVVISNPLDQTVTSRTATVQVYPPPLITAHPQSRSVVRGRNTSLSVSASGQQLTFQWLRDGQVINGATLASLNFTQAQALDSGSYRVRVSNGAGEQLSDVATLTVVIPPVVATMSLPDAIVGQPYRAQLSAANEPTAFQISNLPKGLSIAADKRSIEGIPRVARAYDLRVTASNAAGSSGAAVINQLLVTEFPASMLGAAEGVIGRHQALNQNLGGWMRFSTNRLAAVSASIRLGTRSHRIKGAWLIEEDGVPRLRRHFKRGKQTIQVLLEAQQLGESFTTTLTYTDDAGQEQDLSFPVFPELQDVTTMEGNYTLTLSPSEARATAPEGHGIGGFSLTQRSTRGRLRIADGTSFAFAGKALKDGRVRIWRPLYGNRGVISGFIQVDPAQTNSLAASSINWWKSAARSPRRSYLNGFDELSLNLAGAIYTAPAAGSALSGFDALSLSFSEGGIPDPESRVNLAQLTLPPGKILRPTITGANPAAIQFKWVSGTDSRFRPGITGALSGHFTLEDPHPDNPAAKPIRRRAPFHAMVIQTESPALAHGFFLLAELPSAAAATTAKNSPIRSGRIRMQHSTD
jgi:DNA-binding beta-propeller fold protein YncE